MTRWDICHIECQFLIVTLLDCNSTYMKYKTGSYIIVMLAFSILGMLLWVYGCHRQISDNNEIKRIFDTYYANSEYYLSGQVISIDLLYDYGTMYRDVYVLEIDVDSFEIYKNDLKIGMPFLGVYDSICNKAYIQSPIYNGRTYKEYQKGDMLPTVRVNSTDGVIHFSDGLQSGMLVVEKSDALSAKENRNTIRF